MWFSFNLWLIKGVYGRFVTYFDHLTNYVTKCGTGGN
jgi:hypothetical protein